MEKTKKNKIIVASIWTSCIVLGVLLFSLLYIFVWKVPVYNIILTNNFNLSNILQGEGSYQEGEEVTITATKVEGYSFLNWTYKEQIVSEEYSYTFVISNQTQGEYKANYLQRDFLIKKESSNGSFDVKQSAKAGEEVSVENIIADKGFEFDKLYYCEYGKTDKIDIKENKFIMPANNVTITALFSPISYSIETENYDYANIQLSQKNAYYKEDINLSISCSTGYNVERVYYLSEDGQTEIDIVDSKFQMPARSIKIYIVLQLENYTINYNLNGGNAEGFIYSYNINSPQIEVPVPTREGYVFLGWIGSGLSYATKNLVITGQNGNLEFSALWEKI